MVDFQKPSAVELGHWWGWKGINGRGMDEIKVKKSLSTFVITLLFLVCSKTFLSFLRGLSSSSAMEEGGYDNIKKVKVRK